MQATALGIEPVEWLLRVVDEIAQRALTQCGSIGRPAVITSFPGARPQMHCDGYRGSCCGHGSALEHNNNPRDLGFILERLLRRPPVDGEPFLRTTKSPPALRYLLVTDLHLGQSVRRMPDSPWTTARRSLTEACGACAAKPARNSPATTGAAKLVPLHSPKPPEY